MGGNFVAEGASAAEGNGYLDNMGTSTSLWGYSSKDVQLLECGIYDILLWQWCGWHLWAEKAKKILYPHSLIA